MAISLKNLSKKSLALVIVGGLLCLGAVIADVILVVKLLEQWKELISAIVLTGAAIGFGIGVYKTLSSATKTTTV